MLFVVCVPCETLSSNQSKESDKAFRDMKYNEKLISVKPGSSEKDEQIV